MENFKNVLVRKGKNTTYCGCHLAKRYSIMSTFFLNIGVILGSTRPTDICKMYPPVSKKGLHFSLKRIQNVYRTNNLKNVGKMTGWNWLQNIQCRFLVYICQKYFNCRLCTQMLENKKGRTYIHEGNVKTDPSNFRPL